MWKPSITKRQTFNILSIGMSAYSRAMAPVLIILHYSKTMGISYPFVKNDVKRTSGISACCCYCCCFESEPLGRGNENKSVYYRAAPVSIGGTVKARIMEGIKVNKDRWRTRDEGIHENRGWRTAHKSSWELSMEVTYWRKNIVDVLQYKSPFLYQSIYIEI